MLMDLNEGTNKVEQVTETMNRMQDRAKGALSDMSNRLVESSRVAANTTDAYVHEYAWSSVALAALLGVAIGLMMRRS
jgi:ElaB/YqjD/DUF883 family membrane-anchored ribosome-binding protein